MGAGSDGVRTNRVGRQNGDADDDDDDDDDDDESMVETDLDGRVVVGSLSMRSLLCNRLDTRYDNGYYFIL